MVVAEQRDAEHGDRSGVQQRGLLGAPHDPQQIVARLALGQRTPRDVDLGRDRYQLAVFAREAQRRARGTDEPAGLLDHALEHVIEVERRVDRFGRVGDERGLQHRGGQRRIEVVHVASEPAEPLEVLLLVVEVPRADDPEADQDEARDVRVDPAVIAERRPHVVRHRREQQAHQHHDRQQEHLPSSSVDLLGTDRPVGTEVAHPLFPGDLVSQVFDRRHGRSVSFELSPGTYRPKHPKCFTHRVT